MPSEKRARMLALIYPHAGGYIARILPAGITCFSDSLDGLQAEIEAALADYRADAEEFSEAVEDFVQSISQAEWDDAEGESTLFYYEPGEDFNQ